MVVFAVRSAVFTAAFVERSAVLTARLVCLTVFWADLTVALPARSAAGTGFSTVLAV